MMLKSRVFLLALTLLLPFGLLAQTYSNDEQAIVQVKNGLIETLNKKESDKVLVYLHPAVKLIFMNTYELNGREQVREWFQSSAVQGSTQIRDFKIESLDIEPPMIKLEENVYLISGKGVLVFNSGRTSFSIPSRWMATITKVNNQWLVSSFQNTVNILENPVLEEMHSRIAFLSVITFILGLVVAS